MRRTYGDGFVYDAGANEAHTTIGDMIRPQSKHGRPSPFHSVCVMAVFCLLLVAPRTAWAQGEAEHQSGPSRLYVGMWTTHLRELDRGVDSNHLVGVLFRGFYGATFINSFGDRAVTAGIQRVLTPRPWTDGLALGYRAGLITGYDERFLSIAGWAPVIPFAQLIGSLDRGRVGVELAYAGVVASLATSIRL